MGMFRYVAWILLWMGVGCAHIPPQPPIPAQNISTGSPLALTSNRPLRMVLPRTVPSPTCIEILASLPRGFEGHIELFLQVPLQREGPPTLQPDSVYTPSESAKRDKLTEVSWTHCPSNLPTPPLNPVQLMLRLITTSKSNYVFLKKLAWSEASKT